MASVSSTIVPDLAGTVSRTRFRELVRGDQEDFGGPAGLGASPKVMVSTSNYIKLTKTQ
jgi:hypothetical protein